MFPTIAWTLRDDVCSACDENDVSFEGVGLIFLLTQDRAVDRREAAMRAERRGIHE